VDVRVQDIAVGDLLLVRPGERVPCDGEVVEGDAAVDTSRITGEPLPRVARPGVMLPSGSVNSNSPFTMRATARAEESQYARIVQLVREAQASKAPLQRIADRYATWFTPLTLIVCGIAWLVSGDSSRVLAVLVVATPCPLILATPIAMVGGINRAARRHMIFRNGAALERLATVNTGIFDKTGTLTIGRPVVAGVEVLPGWTESDVLARAAAVESSSGHLLARSVVDAAVDRRIPVPEVRDVREWPGQGVSGTVAGQLVTVGGLSFIESKHPAAMHDLADLLKASGGLRAIVAIDGRGAGVIHYADEMRPGLPDFFRELHRIGVRRLALLSGDTAANAEAVAKAVGIDEVHGDLLPADKVAFVRECLARGERVMMVGDGTNDAPALSAATVGIALAAHGGGVSAESADIVLLVDDPTRLLEAIEVSRDTMRIAHQSIRVGLGLSGVAMVFAAAGFIVPVAGALLQEAIDVGVILNALRARRV
jgi:heavy metal translocating P-type ATPase